MDLTDIRDFIASCPKNEPPNQTEKEKKSSLVKIFFGLIFLNAIFTIPINLDNLWLGIMAFAVSMCVSVFLIISSKRNEVFLGMMFFAILGIVLCTSSGIVFFNLALDTEKENEVYSLLLFIDLLIYIFTSLITYIITKIRIKTGFYKNKTITGDRLPAWLIIGIIGLLAMRAGVGGGYIASIISYFTMLLFSIACVAFSTTFYMRHRYVQEYGLKDAIVITHIPVNDGKGKYFKKDNNIDV